MDSTSSEYDELIRKYMFSGQETRAIMTARKKLNFNITYSSTNDLQHYKELIQYEINLLKTVHSQRLKYNIPASEGTVEQKMVKRIKDIYDFCVQNFQDDLVFCLEYFTFCKKIQDNASALTVVNILLDKHASRPKTWQLCAKWYANEVKDINLALKTLDKGRELHKDCDYLYEESILLEISKYLAIKDAKKDNFEEVEISKNNCLEKLKLYSEPMFANIKSHSFYIQLLGHLEQHEFTFSLQMDIEEFMMDNLSDDPMVWHTLAQREQKNVHGEEGMDISTETRLTLCFAKYDEGLKHEKLSHEGKSKLWLHYIDYLIELQLDDFSDCKSLTKNQLLKTFEQGFQANYLLDRHYVQWAYFVTNDEDARTILKHGTDAIPGAVDIWKRRFEYYVKEITKQPANTQLLEEFENVFNYAISCVQQDSLPLWKVMIRFKILYGTFEETVQMYRRGIDQPQKISTHLKCEFIEWLTVTKGINAARQVYEELAFKQPYCKEFHARMIRLEEVEMEPNFESWEKILNNACEQFGSEDEEVWLNYINFLKNIKKQNEMEKIAVLRNKAQIYLNQLLYTHFLDKYKVLINA